MKKKEEALRGNNPSSLQVFFNKGFACLHLCWVEQVDFGNFGSEVGAKFNGMVIGTMGRKLVMGLLQKDVCKVFAPFRYGQFD